MTGQSSSKTTTTTTVPSRSALLLAGTVLALTAASLYLYKNKRKSQRRRKGSFDTPLTGETTKDHLQDKVDPQLQRIFQAAAQESKTLKQISNTEKLILYSLYKQSVEGDAPDKMPGLTINLVEKAKYSAWERVRGMTKMQAMIHYIEAVQQLKVSGGSKGGGGPTDAMDLLLDDDLPVDSGFMGSTQSTLMANEEEDDGNLTVEQQFLRAVGENNVELVKKFLKDNNSLIHYKDEDGQSALHLAADKGAIGTLNVLIEAGADVNAADGDGITVLQTAVIAENVEVCRLLLNHRANPDQKDVDGDTPRDCAENDGSEEMKELFASYNTKKQ